MIYSLFIEMILLAITSVWFFQIYTGVAEDDTRLIQQNSQDVVYSFLSSNFEDTNQCIQQDGVIVNSNTNNYLNSISSLFDKDNNFYTIKNNIYLGTSNSNKEINNCIIFYSIEWENKYIYIKQDNKNQFEKQEIFEQK